MSGTRKHSTIVLLSRYGSGLLIKHRDGVCRRRRPAAEDIRAQEERAVLRLGVHLGYFFTNRARAQEAARARNPAPGHKSNKTIIKSANVFLTKAGIAKLGDMNVSKVVRKEAMC